MPEEIPITIIIRYITWIDPSLLLHTADMGISAAPLMGCMKDNHWINLGIKNYHPVQN